MLDEKTIQAIESALARDERVELIPKLDKGTVKVFTINREEIKAK